MSKEMEQAWGVLSSSLASPASHTLAVAIRQDVFAFAKGASWTRHPLGFFKSTLWRDGPRNLRLHVWSGRSVPQPELAIHSHSWHLTSMVLAGSLQNRLFQFHEGVGTSFEAYDVSYGDGISCLTPTRRFGTVSIIADGLHTQGCIYSVSPGVFHQTVVLPVGCLVTLVASREETLASAQVLSPRDHDPHEVTFVRAIESSEEVMSLLRAALDIREDKSP